MFRSRDDADIDEEEEFFEPEEEQEDEESIAATEAAFRAQRAAVLACSDLSILRDLRAEFVDMASRGDLFPVARIRAGDSVDLVDDRIQGVRARQVTGRSR